MHYWVKCNMCEEVNYIKCDGDNPVYCPDCYTVDDMSEVEEEEVS